MFGIGSQGCAPIFVCVGVYSMFYLTETEHSAWELAFDLLNVRKIALGYECRRSLLRWQMHTVSLADEAVCIFGRKGRTVWQTYEGTKVNGIPHSKKILG